MKKYTEVLFKIDITCDERTCGKCKFIAGAKMGNPFCEILNESAEVLNSCLMPIGETYLRLPECLTAEVTTHGIERISAERKRQIEKEEFTAEHDDRIPQHNLARAAACYALPEKLRNNPTKSGETRIPLFDFLWPWNLVWWKPTPDNRIRELEKAGALIAAEIDKLLRTEAQDEKRIS